MADFPPSQPRNHLNHTVFPLEDIQAIVAWHNVAGPQGVLCAASDEIVTYLNNHYAARAADHIPYIGTSAVQRFIWTEDPAQAQRQIAYRSRIADEPMTAIADLNIVVEAGIKRALFVPYIHLSEVELPAEIQWTVYGLPWGMTQALKNKAVFHEWLVGNGFAEFTVNFVNCPIADVPMEGTQMLSLIRQMYADCGMTDVYPLGLMVRGAQSDGNYGSGSLRQSIQDEDIHGTWVKQGQIVLKKDGTVDPVTVFDTWGAALEALRDHLFATIQAETENRVVMTRLLDVWVSPGMAGIVTQGDLRGLKFNGQYSDPGDSACSGTWSFEAAMGEDFAAKINARYLAQSQALFKGIVERFLAQYPKPEQVYGMLNIDLMIVGGMEDELYHRALEIPSAKGWLRNFGRHNLDYLPRIYEPSRVLIAEINPRDTNWTLAMKSVLQAQKQPCTIGAIERLGNGEGVRVLARDRWKLPPHAAQDFERVRERLWAFHQSLQAAGEGFILRMADDPAGIIVYTPSDDSHRLQTLMKMAYQQLSD